MGRVRELREWLARLADDEVVAIAEDGAALMARHPDGSWSEPRTAGVPQHRDWRCGSDVVTERK